MIEQEMRVEALRLAASLTRDSDAPDTIVARAEVFFAFLMRREA